jgi:hypothetical protein
MMMREMFLSIDVTLPERVRRGEREREREREREKREKERVRVSQSV